jgi:ribonuclease BN (tRNA processing enzyme)
VSGLRASGAGLCSLLAALAALLHAFPAIAQPAAAGFGARADAPAEFIVLGTASGPNSEAARAQPANALVVGGQIWLVDAGDGAVAQLAKANLRLGAVRGVFLSHLHFDHTGGMFAVLGLRMQLEQRGQLRVVGPPGTRALVDGLLAASAPAMRAGYGIPGQAWSADIEVAELGDGDSLSFDGFTVTVRENSHFSLPDGAGGEAEGVSLSYRFDLADRSIVYTGDTGPSEALVELASGADLLVSEMIDVDAVLAAMRPGGARGQPPADRQLTGFEWHMHAHHMTPLQVGQLAAEASVGRLVITHFAPNPATPAQGQAYLDAIAMSFDGPAELASDLGRY